MTTSQPSDTDSQHQPPKQYLVGQLADTQQFVKCCPHASSLLCRELETGRDAIIAIPCRRWGCRWCGQRKAFHLAAKCETAKPTRLITLTVDPKRWLAPLDAYNGTRRRLSDFSKCVRKEIGSFAYFRVLEATKKGWPHYHLVARCPYIPQPTISRIWGGLTGATIVDVRQIKPGMNVFKYILKYLCKQQHIPWTNRRVSWSHDFFPKPESQERRQNPFVNRSRHPKHPADVLNSMYHKRIVTNPRPNVWLIEPPEPTDCDS